MPPHLGGRQRRPPGPGIKARVAAALDRMRTVRPCRICGREAGHLLYVHQLRPDRYPAYSFCSLACQDAGAAIAKRMNGMIGKTEIETQAIKQTRKAFAEVIDHLGLMPAFES